MIRNRPKPRSAPKSRGILKRAVLPVTLAAAIAAGSHVALKNVYGPSYPKRAPLVGRMLTGGDRLDFYLSRHMLSSDLKGLEPILDRAKAEGRPYNVLIVEGAHSTPEKRRAYEARAGKWVEQINEATSMMRLTESEMNRLKAIMRVSGESEELRRKYDTVKRAYEGSRANLEMLDTREAHEDSAVQKAYDSGERMTFRDGGSDGFSLREHKIAAKYGLHIKVSEEWAPNEATEMRELLRSSLTPPEGLTIEQQRRYFIGRFAEYMRRRNENISRTMRTVKSEIKSLPGMKREPLRGVIVFGSEHEGTAEALDRDLMADVGVVYKESETAPGAKYESFYRDVEKAKALSKRPISEIRRFQNGIGKR